MRVVAIVLVLCAVGAVMSTIHNYWLALSITPFQIFVTVGAVIVAAVVLALIAYEFGRDSGRVGRIDP